MRLSVLTFAAMLLAPPVCAQSAGPPKMSEEVRVAAAELTEASGAVATTTTMLTLLRTQMITGIQTGSGKTAAEAASIVDDLLLPEMRGRVGELVASLTEVYAANYTVDEMHDLAAFYRSPLGQRMIAAAPKIGQQSFAAGQAWGRQVAMDALTKNAAELKKRGVKP